MRKANPILKLQVSRKGRILYEKDDSFDRFQLYAAHLYADTKFLRREREEVLKERMKSL